MRCADCGAEQAAGESCEDCFHALLAFEAEHPAAFGAVHHVTVASYSLQHPRGYAQATLRAWRELLEAALVEGASVAQIRARVGERFAGGVRVREALGEPPAGWPREWPMTVRDVLRPGQAPAVEEYIARARRWAESVRKQLAT